LTGSLGDGAAGLYTVKQCGGVAIVQDPEDAVVSSMPLSALQVVEPDHVLALDKIAAVLLKLSATAVKKKKTKCPTVRIDMNLCTERPDVMQKKYGPPSSVICPDCGGPLWELRDGKVKRFRCLVGHIYSPESLLDEEKEGLERALWTATKILEERAAFLKNMARESEGNRQMRAAHTLDERAQKLEEQADTIRKITKRLDPT
jgi:two-component system chemotaxis response regulator CheB